MHVQQSVLPSALSTVQRVLHTYRRYTCICSVSPIANPIQPNCYRNRLTCFPSINFRNITSAPSPSRAIVGKILRNGNRLAFTRRNGRDYSSLVSDSLFPICVNGSTRSFFILSHLNLMFNGLVVFQATTKKCCFLLHFLSNRIYSGPTKFMYFFSENLVFSQFPGGRTESVRHFSNHKKRNDLGKPKIRQCCIPSVTV